MTIKKDLEILKKRVDEELFRFDQLVSELNEALKDDYIRFRERIWGVPGFKGIDLSVNNLA